MKAHGSGRGAFQPQRLGAPQPRRAPAAQHKARLIQAAAARAADHLQQLVRLDFVLQLVEPVARCRDEHRAQRKIDARAEAQRGDDGAELAGLGERLDDPRALRISQTTVMVGHPLLHQLREPRPQQVFLLRA